MNDENMVLKGKNILLGVTGSIAAYKSAELVRLLRDAGAHIKVVMTAGSSAFITPLTLQALSGQRVYQTLLDADNEAAMSHIDLARWAELIIIAPATANVIAKLSIGFADDLLTTLCLASAAPIIVAPAMNKMMWFNAATQNNINILRSRGIRIIEPNSGAQACGEVGVGRMQEPQEIINTLTGLFSHSQRLCGKTIIITAGPTQEAIDPVRYISNYSSGKMGYAMAAAAAKEGAEVILISGPTTLDCPPAVKRINVISAQDMYNAVIKNIKQCHLFIATAAVADYRSQTIHEHKLKKTQDTQTLCLSRTPDILQAVASQEQPPITIGFAAETENLIEYATKKLHSKKLNMIVANWVGNDKGFNNDYNEVVVITANIIYKLSQAPKKQLAKSLIDIIINQLLK